MKRNGKTKAGSQRWRRVSCGASAVRGNDTAARDLSAFVGWLLSRETQLDMPGQGRTFRRRTARFVSVNTFFTISTNASSPIAPPLFRRSRQRRCAGFV